MKRRVLLVEDDLAVRHDVAAALSAPDSGFVVVAQAGAVSEAQALLKGALAVDAALIDLGLPDGRGTTLITALHQTRPTVAVVVFSVFDDAETVLEALRAGARGYLLKSTPRSALAKGLHDALDGGSPLSAKVASHLVAAVTPDEGDQARLRALTPREREVLGLLARGCSYAEVARMLGIGLGTVQGYVKVIYSKLEVSSKAEATALAVRAGLA